MRLPVLLSLLTILFACGNHPEIKKTKGDLNYISTGLKSEQLDTRLNLTADIKKNELQAELDLTNLNSGPITITGIEIATPEGLRSLPIKGNIDPVVLETGKSRLITLKFQPLNDLKTNQLTGKNGYYKPGYQILITFNTDKNPAPILMSLKADLPADQYKSYLEKEKVPAFSYSFKTTSDFSQQQSAYLASLKQFKQAPFVFVSDQEIAAAGVNLRLRSYCAKDTLSADIFIVNHSEFAVHFNQDNLDFISAGEPSAAQPKIITIEKISGPQQSNDRIEKGERLLIHLKKYFKDPGEQAVLSFHQAFEIGHQIPLYKRDIELVKVILP
ncbi:hypothetical protein [Pedobacter cryoconitis]|uniref:Lipoprotein n=1 Tax=Pedobacter cryoconitis TaxID=188932 RepID=A0A7X0J326_9SPHI|nr:hypothetical protein [Pedobacter cryoconitis]MBB6498882.1 hypothetical protein [Pedobacter cryoconitis]